jgi:hypothetical protein
MSMNINQIEVGMKCKYVDRNGDMVVVKVTKKNKTSAKIEWWSGNVPFIVTAPVNKLMYCLQD